MPEAKENVGKIIKIFLVKTILFFVFFRIMIEIFEITDANYKTQQISLCQILICYILTYVLFDLSFYFLHIFLHKSSFLLRYIHKEHNDISVPSMWSALNMSSAEISIIIVSAFIVTLIIKYIFSIIYPEVLSYSLNISWTLGILFTLEHLEYMTFIGHTNREFIPHKILHLFPFNCLGTCTMHALHHSRMECCYGSFLNIWDKLFKTLSLDYSLILKRVSNGQPLNKIDEKINVSDVPNQSSNFY